jgi:hypothetical protein
MTDRRLTRQQLREREKLGELDAGKFVAVEVVAAIDASLEPAHDDGALCQVQVVPPQITCL